MVQETKNCRHGTFTFHSEDSYVGRSLAMYGEFSEEEVNVFAQVLRKGDVALDVGANIGALTIPMARMCDRVYAFEAQPENYQLLQKNLEQNNIENVFTYNAVVTKEENREYDLPGLSELGHTNYGCVEVRVPSTRGRHGTFIRSMTIDSLELKKLKFMKIDVEGHELEVLQGAVETIKRCRPYIYFECDRPEKQGPLVHFVAELGYRMYWHRPPLFTPFNARLNQTNVFGHTVSINIMAYPEESGAVVEGAEEVADLEVTPEMYDRELARYRRILEHAPNDPTAHVTLAHYYNLVQDHAKAEWHLNEALKIDAENVQAKMIKGLHQLQVRNWLPGWEAYELRYKQRNTQLFGNRPREGQKWDGQRTTEPVLFWCEQGFGDSIMFCRFLKRAMALAPNCYVEVQPQMYELFEQSNIVPQGRMFRLGRTLPHYKKHCSLPSLPNVLGLKYDGEMYRKTPYLFADDMMIKKWRDRNEFKIGFAPWGSRISERPYSRDINAELLRPLIDKYGPWLDLCQSGQWESFADSAAAICSLDLVISVDTSTAHLAAALGVETWLLLSTDPDFRWGLGGSETIWYDHIRIFRQKTFMDWSTVVAEVDQVLEQRYMNKAA